MAGFHAVVLAAGQGTRMKSAIPKVLHPLALARAVSHVLRTAAAAGAVRCSAVIPPDAPGFEKLNPPIETRFFVQEERLGTAHAVLAARAELDPSTARDLVVYADTPLVRPRACRAYPMPRRRRADGRGRLPPTDPTGYGRLIATEAES